MPRNFTITTPKETVAVGPDGSGEMTFTVTNVSGFPTRGLAKIVPQGNTKAEWLTPENVEREFPAGGVDQFRVKANIPPGMPAAKYPWRFDMVSAIKSGEESDIGPVVAFEVAAATPVKKGIPWWVWLAIIVGVIVIGVVAWLKFRPAPPPPPPPPPEVTKVKVPKLKGDALATAIIKIQDAGLRMRMEEKTIRLDPRMRIRGLNTVIDQHPPADSDAEKGSDVTIVVLVAEGSKPNLDLTGVPLTSETKLELDRVRRRAAERVK